MNRRVLLALATVVTVAGRKRVQAKAHFMDLPAAVAAADAVAIVQVETSEKVPATKKGYWTYGQKNTFRFLEFVKRAPFVDPAFKGRQVLWAEKDFVCASESFRPGPYLWFLESVEAGEWIPVNHHRGVMGIEEGLLHWPYGEIFDEKRTVARAKAAVANAKASAGSVRFTAEIVGSFDGPYNRWIPSRSHQVIVFNLLGKQPSPWPAERLFAHAMIPRDVADRETYATWVATDGRLSVLADWIDGSLVIREGRRLPPQDRASPRP